MPRASLARDLWECRGAACCFETPTSWRHFLSLSETDKAARVPAVLYILKKTQRSPTDFHLLSVITPNKPSLLSPSPSWAWQRVSWWLLCSCRGFTLHAHFTRCVLSPVAASKRRAATARQSLKHSVKERALHNQIPSTEHQQAWRRRKREAQRLQPAGKTAAALR